MHAGGAALFAARQHRARRRIGRNGGGGGDVPCPAEVLEQRLPDDFFDQQHREVGRQAFCCSIVIRR